MKYHILGLLLPIALSGQQVGARVSVTQAPGIPAPVQAPETKPEDRCSMEGQVLNAATGDPVKKANLLLRRADLTPNTANFPTTYSTATDTAGAFAMKDIEPGKYRLSVSRTGFVNGEYGARGPMRQGTTLTLDSKQRLQGIVVRLTPQAVVTGRVVDEDREPVAAVQVQMMRYRYNQGRKQLMPVGGASTNDLGEYRIFGLAPGRYYVSATYRGGMMMEMTVDRSASQQPEEDYVPTYYPGTTDAASAATVEATPGAQVRGIDFTLSKTRTVRIKGRVNNMTGSSTNRVMLQLVPRDGSFWGMNRPTPSDAKGSFEMRGIAPGAYTLIASIFDRNQSYSVRQPLDVGSNSVENVTLTINPGMDVTGQLRIDGQSTARLADIRVNLQGRDTGGIMFGPMPNFQIKEDGKFTSSNVAPDHFNFFLHNLPEGFYVKSIRAGDVDVLAAGLDLSKGPAGPIDIVLSPNAGQVDGAVQNDKQQPAAGATVVLIPQDKERRDQMTNYKTVTTDQYGHFTIKSIDPGEYKVFAWEDVEMGAYMDPEFVKPVESQGASVTIRESSRESLQLKLIPAETAQAGKAGSNN